MKLETKLDFAKVDRDKENEVVVMATITAPEAVKTEKRKPLNIVAVIDVSGSMSGGKLEKVQTSCDVMIDHMTDQDSLAVVEFTTESRVVMPLTKLAGKKQDAKNAIHGMHSQRSTNLSGGITDGFSCLKDANTTEATTAVLVFTDGLANQGISDGKGLADLLTGLRARDNNVRTSFFGYGADHDGDLLATLAKIGGGNYHFMNDPEKIAAAFGDEFGCLLTVVGQNLKLEVVPNNGVTILEVLDDVTVEEKQTGAVLSLGDILAEDKKHYLVKVKLPVASKAVSARAVTVLDLTLTWVDPEGKDQTVSAKAKVHYVKAADADVSPDKEVDAQINRIKVATASVEAKNRAEAGDFAGARDVLSVCLVGLRSSVSNADPFVCGLVEDAERLSGDLTDRVSYLSSGGASNLRNYSCSIGTQTYTGESTTSRGMKSVSRSRTEADFSVKANKGPDPLPPFPTAVIGTPPPAAVTPEPEKKEEKKGLSKTRTEPKW